MKKAAALALALTLTASLAAPAFAAGDQPMQVFPEAGLTDSAREETQAYTPAVPYAAALTLNGERLDASAVPDAPGIPLRLLAESDHGYANWYEDESRGYASLDGYRVYVTVPTGEIELEGVVLEDLTATIRDGVTFLPVEFFALLDGYSVSPAVNGDGYDITTPNGAPLVKLAYAIREASGMTAGMKRDVSEFAENYSLPQDAFAEGVIFSGFSTSPDAMVLARLAEGADAETVKTALEAQKQGAIDTFSWYLAQNLSKAQAAQIVFNGDYVLFLIADDAEKGVELFNAFVAEHTEA